jgi:general secretion pathway protein G
MNNKKNEPGFTLIELLIVVAIIAILVAIAVPNFLEAQTRAKVSRVKSDMRSLATAIESYHTDNNHYPWFNAPGFPPKYNSIIYRLSQLTTPIAYISSVDFNDPFLTQASNSYNDGFLRYHLNYRNHEYWTSGSVPWIKISAWVLNSIGPDTIANKGLLTEMEAQEVVPKGTVTLYDPTNGTISSGDIPRTGGQTRFTGSF